MKRILLALTAALSLSAAAQQLTPTQITTLRAGACANTATARPLMLAGDANALGQWFNSASTFIVRRSRVNTAEIGPVLNYAAVAALTTANRDRATTFVMLNPQGFAPTADVETYWSTTFSGALDGQGQATRDALAALWRRAATQAERILATGTGTTVAPGALTWEGAVPQNVTTGIVFNDDGTLVGCP